MYSTCMTFVGFKVISKHQEHNIILDQVKQRGTFFFLGIDSELNELRVWVVNAEVIKFSYILIKTIYLYFYSFGKYLYMLW